MSNKLKNIEDDLSLFDFNFHSRGGDNSSYNFDDEEDDFSWGGDDLNGIIFLYRMIGINDEKNIYVLKDNELESKEISLFNLKQEFLKENLHFCNNDCFLQFMFFVVMANKNLKERYMKNKRVANLIIERIKQLARTDEIFKSKVKYIRISPIARQSFMKHADHWDLKYAEEHHSKDHDIQQLLYGCTIIYDVSEKFTYTNGLTSGKEIENRHFQTQLKLT